jgi:hypothetical protein
MGDDRQERQRSAHTMGSSVLTPPTGIEVVRDDAGSPVLDDAVSERLKLPAPREPQGGARDGTAAIAGSCLCGHGGQVHEHWRSGSDCSVCGPTGCPSFRRRVGGVRRVLIGLRLVH